MSQLLEQLADLLLSHIEIGAAVVAGATIIRIGLPRSGFTLLFKLLVAVSLLARPRRRSDGDGSRNYLIDLLLPMTIQSDVQANLTELMPLWIEAHGEKRAVRVRRWQVFRIIIGHYWTAVAKAAEKVIELVLGR